MTSVHAVGRLVLVALLHAGLSQAFNFGRKRKGKKEMEYLQSPIKRILVGGRGVPLSTPWGRCQEQRMDEQVKYWFVSAGKPSTGVRRCSHSETLSQHYMPGSSLRTRVCVCELFTKFDLTLHATCHSAGLSG